MPCLVQRHNFLEYLTSPTMSDVRKDPQWSIRLLGRSFFVSIIFVDIMLSITTCLTSALVARIGTSLLSFYTQNNSLFSILAFALIICVRSQEAPRCKAITFIVWSKIGCHVLHTNLPRDAFENDLRHLNRYSEGERVVCMCFRRSFSKDSPLESNYFIIKVIGMVTLNLAILGWGKITDRTNVWCKCRSLYFVRHIQFGGVCGGIEWGGTIKSCVTQWAVPMHLKISSSHKGWDLGSRSRQQ